MNDAYSSIADRTPGTSMADRTPGTGAAARVAVLATVCGVGAEVGTAPAGPPCCVPRPAAVKIRTPWGAGTVVDGLTDAIEVGVVVAGGAAYAVAAPAPVAPPTAGALRGAAVTPTLPRSDAGSSARMAGVRVR